MPVPAPAEACQDFAARDGLLPRPSLVPGTGRGMWAGVFPDRRRGVPAGAMPRAGSGGRRDHGRRARDAGAKGGEMYGLIGSARARTGRRDETVAILLENMDSTPGRLSDVVAEGPGDPDVVWITEGRDSAGRYRASLALPAVRGAIARGKPLIAAFGQHTETRPVGGHGLAPAA